MRSYLAQLRVIHDRGGTVNPVRSPREKYTFKETPIHNKTKDEEDQDMFMRYWRYVRKYRKARNWKKASYWIGEMKKLKRFMNTTKDERYPDIYSKCHKVIAYLVNEYGMYYRELSDLSGTKKDNIKFIILKSWQNVSEDMTREIYNELLPEAKKRGYDES